jgi:hypothetical protein
MRNQSSGQRPGRTFIGLFGLLAALLFGGMAVGLGIALMGGGSLGAIVVGFMWLPLCLGLGLAAWRGILAAWLTAGLVRAITRSRGDEARFREATRDHLRGATNGLPGTWVFVPVAIAVSVLAAIAMWLAGSGGGAGSVLVIGAGYGLLLRRLARQGWLPPPGE